MSFLNLKAKERREDLLTKFRESRKDFYKKSLTKEDIPKENGFSKDIVIFPLSGSKKIVHYSYFIAKECGAYWVRSTLNRCIDQPLVIAIGQTNTTGINIECSFLSIESLFYSYLKGCDLLPEKGMYSHNNRIPSDHECVRINVFISNTDIKKLKYVFALIDIINKLKKLNIKLLFKRNINERCILCNRFNDYYSDLPFCGRCITKFNFINLAIDISRGNIDWNNLSHDLTMWNRYAGKDRRTMETSYPTYVHLCNLGYAGDYTKKLKDKKPIRCKLCSSREYISPLNLDSIKDKVNWLCAGHYDIISRASDEREGRRLILKK